jgi:hypothetical protein
MKIHPVGAELFYEDGQKILTDRHDDDNTSRFSKFCERAQLNCVRGSHQIEKLDHHCRLGIFVTVTFLGKFVPKTKKTVLG